MTAQFIKVDSNLNQVIEENQDLLVEFYSPTCGPCKMLNFVLKDAAKELSNNYTIAQINFDESEFLVDKYEVQGYPTVFIYKNGEKVKRFSGVRKKKDILKYIKEA